MVLPYISDKGPRNNGPTAYAKTNIESISWETTSSVTPKSAASDESAGATIDEETGEMKVNSETVIVAAHFFFMLQFFGFSGSSSPDHVTFPGQYKAQIKGSHQSLPALGHDEIDSTLTSSIPQARDFELSLNRDHAH